MKLFILFEDLYDTSALFFLLACNDRLFGARGIFLAALLAGAGFERFIDENGLQSNYR